MGLRTTAVVAAIAVRNLARQYRRNLLLGISIAVGTSLLVVTTAFTNGLTDNLFNKVMTYWTGHLRVTEYSYVTRRSDVIREKARFIKVIRESVPGVKRIDEVASVYGRAVGNGHTALVALLGIPADRTDFFTPADMLQGDPRDIFRTGVFPGILLYKNTADELNVRLNDTVTIRFQSVYGQAQAPNFRVVGILPSRNVFQDSGVFMDMAAMKTYLNVKQDEALALNVVTTYPQDRQKIAAAAQKLRDALRPEAAGVRAIARSGSRSADADVFSLALSSGDTPQARIGDELTLVRGDMASFISDKDGILLTEPLARDLGVTLGSRLTYTYPRQNGEGPLSVDVVVDGIVSAAGLPSGSSALANPDVFYRTYFWNLPTQRPAVSRDSPIFHDLLPEWDVQPNAADSDSLTRQMQHLDRGGWRGARVDVQTMFAIASFVVDLQHGLNLVSVIAVLVLFVVVLIGVINSLRMSIKERTREIGTNRAIGMQRGAVRAVFVLEVAFLTLLSCAVGVLLAFGLVALLGLPTIDAKDNPFGMLLVRSHLYFLPAPASIVFSVLVIVAAAAVIAFFTARRAARMRVADALRHYE